MCGIAGFAGQSGSTDQLHAMAEALRRRGPDDEGFYQSPGVGFAFRRLSIIDLATGHQPLSNQEGTVWVMLNGEIYGYQALREELLAKGYRFSTHSDTEVIIHAYSEWGDECFEKLNGMFIIALWDVARARLLLARDRLGKKPLYWTETNHTLWFGSELKALIAADVVSRDIDLESLGMYFRTDAIPTPRTIFQCVSKLEPGSVMAWHDGAIERVWRFWNCPNSLSVDRSLDEIMRGLREHIDTSVRERLVADVPLGLFLSGGLDSSVIAESAARQSSKQLEAYTIGFEDTSYDERSAAREVARTLGLNLHEEVFTTRVALDMLDEAVECFDEPFSDPSVLPQLHLSRFTRQDLTVALSGDGGDELLLGYQHIPLHAFLERFPFLSGLGRVASPILERIPSGTGYFSFGFKAQRLARGLAERDWRTRDLAWRGAFTHDDLCSFIAPEHLKQLHSRAAEQHIAQRAAEAGPDGSMWNAWTWAYLRTYLMDDVMVKVDRATMWFSLEARAPLLDYRVVEYLMGIPDRWKLEGWGGKRLFQELLRDRLPASVLNRPKHGFGVPVAEWLRTSLHEELRRLADPKRLKTQGLFSVPFVECIIDQHQRGTKDRRKELWAFFMFQRWAERWMRT